MKSFLYFVLIFLFDYNIAGQEFRCDYTYSAIAEGWLKYHEIRATWYDARLRCTLEGAILASPTTPNLLARMKDLMALRNPNNYIYNEFNIFIGIHDTFSKGDYTTVDGIPLDQIPHEWSGHDPVSYYSRDEARCIKLNNKGLLSAEYCNTTLPYFCFKPENTVQEPTVCGTTDLEYQFDSRTNSCYKFHTVPRTFSRANFACTAEGGHLVIINSETEAIILKDLFSQYPHSSMIGKFWKDVAFVGISDWDEHGEWRTIHGETLDEAGYAKFAPGEPNNYQDQGEYCGAIYRDAKLNDLQCDGPHAFICEKRPDYPGFCPANYDS